MLSSKTKLCVKVLVAMASAPSSRPVAVQVLSERLQVSVSHLESIARILREAGLVKSSRGPGGGYCLARDPDGLSIWEVVQCVDEALRDPPSAKPSPIASLESAIRSTFIDFLSSRTVGEFAQAGAWELPAPGAGAVGFRLRPLPRFDRPLAPNSVFQLSAFTGAKAA